MKYSFLPAAALALALLFAASCATDSDPKGPQGIEIDPLSEQTLKINSSAELSPEELFTMALSPLNLTGDAAALARTFRAGYTVKCAESLAGIDLHEGEALPGSKEARSKPTPRFITHSVSYCDTLAGRITYSVHGDDGTPIRPRYIIIDSHPTTFETAQLPSRTISLGHICARMDALYISADLSFGAYLDAGKTGAETLDLLRAALNYCRQKGVRFDPQCACIALGYSQGGSSSLAVHKALEADSRLCAAVGFRGSVCGAAPSDLGVILRKMAGGERAPMPSVVGVIALNTGQPENVLSSSYLQSGALQMLRSGQHSSGEIDAVVRSACGGDKPSNLLKPDALNDGSPAWEFARRNNLLKGWSPAAKIILMHSPDDEVVPYEISIAAREAFPSKVTLKVLSGGHGSAALPFYMSLYSDFEGLFLYL